MDFFKTSYQMWPEFKLAYCDQLKLRVVGDRFIVALYITNPILGDTHTISVEDIAFNVLDVQNL